MRSPPREIRKPEAVDVGVHPRIILGVVLEGKTFGQPAKAFRLSGRADMRRQFEDADRINADDGCQLGLRPLQRCPTLGERCLLLDTGACWIELIK